MPDTVSYPALTDAGRAFVDRRPPRFGTLATINEDGTPHQAVLWYRLQDDGTLLLNSRVGRRWPTNLLRNGHASFLIEDAYEWVALRGEAVMVHQGEEAQADIAALARLYESPEKVEASIRTFRTMERISFVLRSRAVSVHL